MGDCKEHSTCIPHHIPSIFYGLDRILSRLKLYIMSLRHSPRSSKAPWQFQTCYVRSKSHVDRETHVFCKSSEARENSNTTPCWWTTSCNTWPSQNHCNLQNIYHILLRHTISTDAGVCPWTWAHKNPYHQEVVSLCYDQTSPRQEPPEVEEAAQTSKSTEALEHIEDKARLDGSENYDGWSRYLTLIFIDLYINIYILQLLYIYTVY